jgi:outer membrane protein TolC
MTIASCVSAQTRRELREIERKLKPPPPRPAAPASRPPGGPEDEAALARELSLETVLRVALARSPELREGRQRVRAALERTKAASRLPDLEFKYEQWGVPLGSPLALDEAMMLMWGLQQSFPAPGSLDARERMALQEARMLLEAQRARELDVVAKVRRAYYDAYRADWEYRIHVEMVT